MRSQTRRPLVTFGASLALVGAVASIVYFFQPWRTCDYEDTSAGCAVLVADATGMLISLVVSLIGVALFVIGIASRKRT